MPDLRSTLGPLLVLLLAGAAHADNRNAATWYQRAFERHALTDADWDAIDRYRADPAAGPPPGLREAVAKASRVVDLARRGAREAYADHDLDYSQGFELRMPHLAQIRTLSKIMQADALLHLHDGDAAGAAQRTASIYRMAEHLRGDHTLISSLVGQAIFAAADQTTQAGIDRGVFSAHDADVMLQGLRPLDGPDPFDMLEAVVVGEQELAVNWMRERMATQADREHFIEDFGWLTSNPTIAPRLAALTDEEFTETIDQYDRMMDRAVVAFGREDPEVGAAELKALSEEIETGVHGPVAMLVAPGLMRIHTLMVEARAKIQGRLTTLRGLATGAILPEEEINAALLYAQGIAALRRLAPERLDAVIAYANGAEADEKVAETLDAAGAAVDLFRAGSQKRRCDFSVLAPDDLLPLCPDHVAGLHDALRTLQADARRALDAAEPDVARDHLGIAYGVIGHLAGDSSLMSALVAHTAFVRVDEIVETHLASGALDADDRRALLDAAERIRRTDPFGYLESLHATRETLARELARPRSKAERGDRERDLAIRTIVRGWDGDELVFVLAVRDAIARAGVEPAAADTGETREPATPGPRHRLDDLLPPEALAGVRDETPLVELALARGDVDLFRERRAPRFADVETHRRTARADLRRGIARLRPPPERPSATPDPESARDETPG